jgi:hypothetical protein
MVAFVLILFWRAPDNPSLLAVIKPEGSPFRAVVLALFAFMPALNFVGVWDSYLSASLYSGSTEEGYVYTKDGSSQTFSTSIFDKAMEELNVPAYPEERVYKRVFAEMWCEKPLSFPKPILVVYSRPEIISGHRSKASYYCKEVQEGE